MWLSPSHLIFGQKWLRRRAAGALNLCCSISQHTGIARSTYAEAAFQHGQSTCWELFGFSCMFSQRNVLSLCYWRSAVFLCSADLAQLRRTILQNYPHQLFPLPSPTPPWFALVDRSAWIACCAKHIQSSSPILLKGVLQADLSSGLLVVWLRFRLPNLYTSSPAFADSPSHTVAVRDWSALLHSCCSSSMVRVRQQIYQHWHTGLEKVLMVGAKLNRLLIFVLRKKGRKTKKRIKEEEIEKGDCGPPTRKINFGDFGGLEPSGT